MQPHCWLPGLEPRISEKAHTTPDVVFLCVKHSHISMVGRAGEPRGSPGPFQPVVPTLHVSPPDDWNLTVVINLTEKVNHMTIQISAETLSPITHNQIPVITTELLAQLYGAEVNNIQQNFKRNAERFVAGKHFFKIEGKDLRDFKNRLTDSQSVAKHTRTLILWTERGAARHAKMLETDQAWEVFEKLEDCYFCQKSAPQTTLPVIKGDSRTLVIRFDENGGIKYTEMVPDDSVVCSIDSFKHWMEMNGWVVTRKEHLMEKLLSL